MRSFTKHLPHYISLIGIFFAAFLAFYFFSFDKFFLSGVTIAVGCAYISWGIIHHLLHKDLYVSVIFEYIAVTTLGVIMVLSLIFRL